MADFDSEPRRLSTLERASALLTGVRDAAELYGVSRFRIAARLAWLWRRHGFRPGEAHSEGLSNPRLTDEHLAGAIPEARLVELQLHANRADLSALVEDKVAFHVHCSGAHLPVPRLYAVVDGSGGWSEGGAPISDAQDLESALEHAPTDLFVKPAGTDWGIGVQAFTRTSTGFQDVSSGTVETASSLVAALTSSRFGRMVVQERLRNHEEIELLTGTKTLQTVRIQTVLTSRSECVMGGCIFKFAAGGGVADNIVRGTTGNFLAGVGLASGVLRAAVRYRASQVGLERVETHPQTGLPIAGFRLPWWEEAKDLVVRAATVFAPLRTIGWDVALTPAGPVLVEGNLRWSPWNCLAACETDLSYSREMATLLALLRTAPALQ